MIVEELNQTNRLLYEARRKDTEARNQLAETKKSLAEAQEKIALFEKEKNTIRGQKRGREDEVEVELEGARANEEIDASEALSHTPKRARRTLHPIKRETLDVP